LAICSGCSAEIWHRHHQLMTVAAAVALLAASFVDVCLLLLL
jgi:hypothetical protein